MATPVTVWLKVDASGKPALYLTDPDAPPTPAPAPVRAQARGANLAGGGTSYLTWPADGSGPVKGTHYQFMNTVDVAKLVAIGMTTFRVLFTWEALQPTERANIATLTNNYQIYRDALYGLVTWLRSVGAKVLLDVHGDADSGFAAYRGAKVGTTTASGAKVEDLLANLWSQLATRYAGDLDVMFGVTNEPHDIAPAVWFGCAQKVINAIRATGNKSKIVMPGCDWDGASSWMAHNAAAWNLTDPSNNLAVQVHMYFDPNAGGGTDEIADVNVGVTRLKDVTAWARAKGLEVWIGEMGLNAANPLAKQTFANTVAFIDANRDVIAGFLWWAAGPPNWWGTYRFGLLDTAGKPTANLNMIASAFTGA